MPSRNYDWRPLGRFGDPIPGAPDDLDRHTDDYRRTAMSLGAAASSLDRLQDSQEMCSEAVTAIMARAKETAGTLKSLKVRYDQIAIALAGYSPALRSAQGESLAALEDATQAKNKERYARSHAQGLQSSMVSSDSAVRNEAVQEHNRCVGEVASAQSAIRAAKARLQAAIDARDDAGETAAGMIRVVVDDSSLNDTLLDKVGAVAAFLAEKIASALQWVWDHLEAICLVLDAIALVLLLTPLAPIGGFILAATWIAGMVKGAFQVATATVAVVKGAVTAYNTGNWDQFTSASVSVGLATAFRALSVVGGPAATPLNAMSKGIITIAAKSVFVGAVGYTAGEVLETLGEDAETRNSTERRVVPCW